MKKKRCKSESKSKSKSKAIRTSFFFGLDVFFGVAYLFYLVTLAIFLFHRWPMAADLDWSQRMLCPSPD